MSKFLDFAIETAREAGAILRVGIRPPEADFLQGRSGYRHGVRSPLGSADRLASAETFSATRDHRRRGRRPAPAAGAKYCWHVDPLDGTTNFAHGYPCFAVSIGLAEEGRPIAGVVFNPVSDELFTRGARRRRVLERQARFTSRRSRSWPHSLVATGFPTHQRKRSANINYYWEFTLRSHGVRRDGSAALDLCSVACGRFEAFWEFDLKSWDSAPRESCSSKKPADE